MEKNRKGKKVSTSPGKRRIALLLAIVLSLGPHQVMAITMNSQSDQTFVTG